MSTKATANPTLSPSSNGAEAVQPITLVPILAWPPQPVATFKWMFGFPGYILPYNALWVALALVTWFFLTPPLAAMATFEAWWVGVILARNFVLILAVFGGLHLYFHVYKRQGTEGRLYDKPLGTGKRFWFNNQVRDNMFWTLASAVPIITGYEALTYWAFANGYLGWGLFSGPELTGHSMGFWVWFVVLLFAAPFLHSLHFYAGHRLLHVQFLYKHFHALHHRNVEVGPWSGLAMHPVEHIIYLSTYLMQWVLALHPVNVLFQLQLAAFLPALSHSGFEKLELGQVCDVDGGARFHYLHHKYFECNYGGSLAPLDRWLGTFHDGTEESLQGLRSRLRARRVSV
jgi:sterol desaturase/sphingolipid hydroxylase (fatty acid hydroxylase superfamily)